MAASQGCFEPLMLTLRHSNRQFEDVKTSPYGVVPGR